MKTQNEVKIICLVKKAFQFSYLKAGKKCYGVNVKGEIYSERTGKVECKISVSYFAEKEKCEEVSEGCYVQVEGRLSQSVKKTKEKVVVLNEKGYPEWNEPSITASSLKVLGCSTPSDGGGEDIPF